MLQQLFFCVHVPSRPTHRCPPPPSFDNHCCRCTGVCQTCQKFIHHLTPVLKVFSFLHWCVGAQAHAGTSPGLHLGHSVCVYPGVPVRRVAVPLLKGETATLTFVLKDYNLFWYPLQKATGSLTLCLPFMVFWVGIFLLVIYSIDYLF